MASTLRLYIQGIGAKTHFLNINSTATITDLLQACSNKFKIPLENLNCHFNTKELIPISSSGISRNLEFYRIKEGSSITFSAKSPGGASFECFKFADITSNDCFISYKLTTIGPMYRTVEIGLNFSGICKILHA